MEEHPQHNQALVEVCSEEEHRIKPNQQEACLVLTTTLQPQPKEEAYLEVDNSHSNSNNNKTLEDFLEEDNSKPLLNQELEEDYLVNHKSQQLVDSLVNHSNNKLLSSKLALDALLLRSQY